MTPQLWWDNLLAYSLQVALLVLAAAALPPALRMRHPRARLLFWQFVLGACVLLPAAEPWRRSVLVVSALVNTAPLPMLPLAHGAPSFPFVETALALAAMGMLLRAGWLVMGMLRLRRYRAASQPLTELSTPLAGLVERLAPQALLCVSADVSGPVTFGVQRPVVLLPPSFAALPEAAQRAVVCHELLHVARRDWLFTVAEECVRALLWFHPGIWWLLGRVQLSREEAVDRAVLEMDASAHDYVDALLAVAGAKPQPDLAPAPLFLQRRQLKQRVTSILEGVSMTKQRILPGLAAGLAGMAAVCWLAVSAFPLQASPQVVEDGNGVTVDSGDASFVHRTRVAYPEAARKKGIQGTVTLDVTIAADGTVSDARVVSGPEELRSAALQSVLQWHFTRASGAGVRVVNLSFRLPAGAAASPAPAAAARPAPLVSTSGSTEPLTLACEFRGLSPEAEAELRASLPFREGDKIDRSRTPQLQAAVQAYDEHLLLTFREEHDSGRLILHVASPGTVPASADAVLADPPPTPGVARIRVGGNVQQAKLVNKTQPIYPPPAKQARIMGQVKLQVLIDKDGNVSNVAVISGHPLLVPSAIDAVRQWRYATTLLNGNPVEVLTQVDVNYTLTA